jgi:tetratricopeptide (TPR) repeat protein
LICLECGKIIEFEDPTLEALQQRIAQRTDLKFLTIVWNSMADVRSVIKGKEARGEKVKRTVARRSEFPSRISSQQTIRMGLFVKQGTLPSGLSVANVYMSFDSEVVYVNQGQNREGEGVLLRAIALEPDDARLYYHLGSIRLRDNRATEAEPAFQKAIQLKPDYGPPHYQLGKLLARAGSFPPNRTTGIRVLPTGKLPSKLGTEEFLRVKIGKVGERFLRLLCREVPGSSPR